VKFYDSTKRITELEAANAILDSIKSSNQLVIQELCLSNDSLDSVITARSMELFDLSTKYIKVRYDYYDLRASLEGVSSDSSYRYLDEVAYPTNEEKTYPFSKSQVSSIHLTYLEKLSLVDMNQNLELQVAVSDTIIKNQVKYISNLQHVNYKLEENYELTQSQLENQIKITSEFSDDNDELRSNNKLKNYLIAGGTILGFILGVVL
jgi:hypothetical protein